ncbi:MAG: hypothetical protein ACM31P_08630 [Actinomycetota bacterium]
MHRAFRTLPWHSVRFPAVVLAVAAWLAAFAFGYGLLADGIAGALAFWREHLGLAWEIRHVPYPVPLLGSMDLLQLEVPRPPPTPADWLANLILMTGAFAASLRLPPQGLPLAYLLRLVVGLHGVSLAYFAVAAEHFPYGIGDHTGSLYRFTMVLVALLPAMLAGTFYVIEPSWPRRLAATLLMVGYFALTLPFKLLAHAAIIDLLSPLAMPVLYLVFGPPLDILLLVALYSWAITWEKGGQSRAA